MSNEECTHSEWQHAVISAVGRADDVLDVDFDPDDGPEFVLIRHAATPNQWTRYEITKDDQDLITGILSIAAVGRRPQRLA